MAHPDRYALALFAAQVEIGIDCGFTERGVLKTLLGLAIGRVVPTSENIERINHGLPFGVWTLPLRLPPQEKGVEPLSTTDRVRSYLGEDRIGGRDPIDAERWRDAFSPYLEDLRLKLHRLRRRTAPRATWHRVMARVFRMFIEHDPATIEQARLLAGSVGEGGIFESELLSRWRG
jgi:hypothetical protein